MPPDGHMMLLDGHMILMQVHHLKDGYNLLLLTLQVTVNSTTNSCSSEEKDWRGERVPLVRMMDLTPCVIRSPIAWPGLKHQ